MEGSKFVPLTTQMSVNFVTLHSNIFGLFECITFKGPLSSTVDWYLLTGLQQKFKKTLEGSIPTQRSRINLCFWETAHLPLP